jgi:hypothetical protein
MCIIEARHHGTPTQRDVTRGAPGQTGNFGASPNRNDSITFDRDGFCPWTERVSRKNFPTDQDQIRWRRGSLRVRSAERKE